MRRPNYLFSKVDWFSVKENQKKKLLDEIARFDGNRMLNTSIDDLSNYFEKEYSIDVPILREDEIVADQNEVQVDVSRDPLRVIRDRTRPVFISGTAVEITIPFDGEPEVFEIRPSNFTINPPIAEVRESTLVLRLEGTDLEVKKVRSQIDRMILEIKGYLENLHRDVSWFNNELRQIAKEAIERRRSKLLADQDLVASLGFPLKERKDQQTTYISPKVRRKIKPTLPPASKAPFKPEPTLSLDDYEHILSVIQNMAHVMELSPSAFTSMDEESLRFHFLVQLNGHYEGQATGETFNYEGKTDILIRTEGKNVFIAECKFWGGPKKLLDTIDQLLSYSSWRDTKVAIIIFNRQKNFSSVLESIQPTVQKHENFKKNLGQLSETSFRYIFAHRDDQNREMILTIIAFDIPKLNV